MRASYRVTPMRLYVDEAGLLATTQAVADLQVIQSRFGKVDGTGRPYPMGVTKQPVDMYDTSVMLTQALDVTAGKIVYYAPYASITQARYQWAGIAPQYMPDLYQTIQVPLSRAIRAEDMGQ